MGLSLRYKIIYKNGKSSDYSQFNIKETDAERECYNIAKAQKKDLNSVPGLEDLKKRAYKEIEEYILDAMDIFEDEYYSECQGRNRVEPEIINKLIEKRDIYTLKYFGLENATEDELNRWDAASLPYLPEVCQFYKDFEAKNPFDCDWKLVVELDNEK